MKRESSKQNAPDSKLNSECFLLPILATFLTTLNDSGAGMLGLLASCFGAFAEVYLLIFRPSPKVKGATWSYLFGFALAVAVFVFVACAINAGQTSPW